MRAMVTGAAGFIGSSLVDRLLNDGHEVVGIDCLTPYYDPKIKQSNLLKAFDSNKFALHTIDLSEVNLDQYLDGVTHVFHQAGQPGVRASWGNDFNDYVIWNVIATQRLLESVLASRSLVSFVAASSSSVYGSAETFPTDEAQIPSPISPYGVSKLAAENLVTLYGTQFGLPTVSLRYFTVYGPRQRPDMAIRRLVECAFTGDVFELAGDGEQIRDFTFIDDVVEANLAASRLTESEPGSFPRVFNIGGGDGISMNRLIEVVRELSERKLDVYKVDRAVGDPRRTGADVSLARQYLDWRPRTGMQEGISKTLAWRNELST
jgi:nucleoside-diphosphate-sugar epimerase